ncbi:hypothetical protein BDF20DRAFT_839614 [Mycotypha africana]|uniref:uncharacterized protein n=1 Tax=Mycotypha africana TaxID=64632 RepID=UPI0023015D60|nr:uncharacterized protein BDF20DRAFT_839614 [Mycotypha africana]KAI8968512.1 hypothetical protein BDF20DRAFT_839614 [Mycotypha africana]
MTFLQKSSHSNFGIPLSNSLRKVDAAEISKAYCYQVICKGELKWPDKIMLNNEDKSKIEMLCKSFEELVTEKHIQSSYEKEHDKRAASDVRRSPLPKHFFSFPLPSLHWRFITISIKSLVSFLFPGTPLKGYMNQLEKFHQVFSSKTMGFKRESKRREDHQNHRLTLKDFDYAEIEAGYRPCFIDPRREGVFTAAIGLDVEKHQVRSCSTKEYYHMTDSTRYSAKLEKKKDVKIKGIETLGDLFSFYGDGTAEDRFHMYQERKRAADKMVNMLINASTKYNLDLRLKKREERRTKQGLKEEEEWQDGFKKTTEKKGERIAEKKSIKEDTLEISVELKMKDSASNAKWKPEPFNVDDKKKASHRVRVMAYLSPMRVGVLRRALKRREAAGDLLVLEIDEFETFRICSCCSNDILERLKGVQT